MTQVVDNDYQTRLLFKQFVGVAAARLDDQFSVEQFSSVPNIFSTTVMVEDIPSQAPIKISGPNGLDASDNWLDSSCNYATNFVGESIFFDPSGSVDNGKTFSEIYPDSNLKFYKRLSLVPCEQNSQGRVWGAFTDYSGVIMYTNKESVLQNTIPFKYDDINATYLPVVRYNKIQGGNGAGTGNPNFQIGNINANPLYWVMDAGTGFLQFYNSQSNLESVGVKDIKTNGIQEKEWAPVISCYVYNGKLGIKNLDISSNGGTSSDISDLDQKIYNLNRVVLPDGYVDISGTNYDLCGNEVVRTYYTYNRDKMYIGYDNLPILDGSAVDHAGDPSFNSINQPSMILTISGNTFMSGGLVQGFFDPPNLTALQGIKGQYSHAEGYRTWAEANYAHTEGRENTINFVGIGSHGEGLRNDISGVYCHAEGFNNNIGEDSAYCHAEGISNNIPLGTGSHIEGNGNIINVTQHPAHAEGGFNQVGPLGAYAHAEGFGTIIDTSGGHSTGHYNDISQNVIFVVGCGSSNVNRMDALYVDTNCITHINNRLEVSGNVDISGDVNIDGNVDISGDVNIDGNVDISGDVNIDGDLYVDGIIESIDGTRFVDYKNFSNDISGSIMGVGNTQWFCIAKIDPGPAGETANGLFVLDDDTSGLRQTIVFRAGSSYSRGNFIDVISNNFYGQRIYDIRIDISGGSYYAGANLYINRGYTTNPSRIFVRVYQNKRKGNPSDGSNIGYWQLTSTPLPDLDQTVSQLNLQFNPGGLLTGNKATTLDTLIDAQLKVTGHIAALGDISMNGGQITYIGDATDNSGVPSWGQVQSAITSSNYWTKIGNDIYYNAGDVIVSNTNLIQEVTLNPFTLPPILPPATFASLIIASVVKTDAITTGYFTVQLTIPNYEQIIHFIAGVIDNKLPFIKVISNTNMDILNGCSNLYIVDDGNDYFLCTDFLYAGGTQVDYIKIVLSNNSQNYSAPLSNNINWILQDLLELPVGPTYTSHVDVSLNLIGGGPYAITSLYEIIDNSFQVNSDLILLENQYIRGDIISTDPSGILDISATLVDISGSLEVENYVLIKGEQTNPQGMALDVYGNAAVRGKLLVDISSSLDDGITIQNTGSGGPMIKLRHQSNSYLGNAQYHTIYVDDPGDKMHIDFGTGSGSHILYLDGNTSNSTVVTGENQGTGNALFQAKVQNGMTTNLVAGNSGRGSLTVNNGFTSGSTPGGIDIQCSGTPSPEHCFYIGSSTLGNVGRAISLKGLTETGGGFSIFTSGEVRINSLLGGGTYEDIDFAINTVDISNAFFVDAALNLITFGVSAEIPNIIGPTSISGDTTINGDLLVNGNTYIDEDLSVNAVTTLTDLSFSDYLNNVARLPSETTIPFRKHQTVSSTPYRDLKVDGYSEYSITTENLSTTNSQEDWVTIARVGFQDMTTQSQRADGLFEITCNNSGTHQTIRLEASHHYKNGQTLDVVKNVTYGLNSNRHIKAARMAYAGIYDGGILQIQISQNTSSTTYTLSKITIKLYYNNNNFGWTSDLSGVSAPLPDNTPFGYSQAGYGGTGNQLWDGSTYSNFILFYPSTEGIDLTERIFAAGNPGQSVLNYTSDMILNKVYMKDNLDLSGNSITNIGSITTNNLRVETSGGTLLFEVEHSNNTAKLGLPLELERDSISNLSSIPQYSMVLANNIGSSWSTNTAYHRDCIVWRPRITSATPSVRILENEHIVQIYNRQISGASSSGGFGGGTQDNNYVKHTGSSITKEAYFGVMPNGANGNASSSLAVNSKMHFIREAWITGIYLNTPFLDSPTFSSSSGSQGLFGFGANDYIDIEIGAPTGSHGYQRVYRLGNPSTSDQDSFYFPSSTWDATTGGVSITLPADEWIYIPAGTNMSRCVRFKAYINSNIWVRNDYSGTSFNRGHVEGYLVYVTSPKMII